MWINVFLLTCLPLWPEVASSKIVVAGFWTALSNVSLAHWSGGGRGGGYNIILLQCDLEASDDSEVLPGVPHGVLQEFSDFNAR